LKEKVNYYKNKREEKAVEVEKLKNPKNNSYRLL
jgi:hypothetical protein